VAGKSEQVLEEMVQFLMIMMEADEPPVWLSQSDAFVVDTTSDRLETIARFPRVSRISRNRPWR
jgi:hypothetical protein